MGCDLFDMKSILQIVLTQGELECILDSFLSENVKGMHSSFWLKNQLAKQKNMFFRC